MPNSPNPQTPPPVLISPSFLQVQPSNQQYQQQQQCQSQQKILVPNLAYDPYLLKTNAINQLYNGCAGGGNVPLVIYPADNILGLAHYWNAEKKIEERIKQKVNDQIEKYQNDELKKLELEKQLVEYRVKLLEQQQHQLQRQHAHHLHGYHPSFGYDYNGSQCSSCVDVHYHTHNHNHVVQDHVHHVSHHANSSFHGYGSTLPTYHHHLHQHTHHDHHVHHAPSVYAHVTCLCDTHEKCVNCTKDNEVLDIENKIQRIREELNLPRSKNQKHCPHEHFNA